MLNQDERRRFNDIAHHLTADRRFARRARTCVPAQRRGLSTMSALCALLVITAPVLVLLGGWATVPPALGVLLVILLAALVRRRPPPR